MRRLKNLQERVLRRGSSGMSSATAIGHGGAALIQRIAQQFNGGLEARGPDDYLFSFGNEEDARGFMDELEKSIADIDWEQAPGEPVSVYVPRDQADRFTGRASEMAEAAGSKKLKKEMKFKDGTSFPAGTGVEVYFSKENPSVALVTPSGSDRAYNVNPASLHKYLPGFTKPPTESTLQKWSDDGIAKSVGGDRVETDGWDSDGTPSWMLAMGVI